MEKETAVRGCSVSVLLSVVKCYQISLFHVLWPRLPAFDLIQLFQRVRRCLRQIVGRSVHALHVTPIRNAADCALKGCYVYRPL